MGELSSIPTFELLGYHLKVLYAIEYYGPARPEDLAREFPGESDQALETEKGRIRVRRISEKAVLALKDLIQEGLVEIRIRPYEIKGPFDDSFRKLLSIKRIGMVDGEAARKWREMDPGFQGEGFWCYDDKGERVDLSDKGVLCTLMVTERGRDIWKLLPKVRERLFMEVLKGL